VAIGYGKMMYFVQHGLKGWRLTRQCNLALLAIGIAGVRDAHLTMAKIARGIPTRADHRTKHRRMWQFLSSSLWSPDELFPSLVRFILERFYPGQRVPVIIDQSTIKGRWCHGSA